MLVQLVPHVEANLLDITAYGDHDGPIRHVEVEGVPSGMAREPHRVEIGLLQ